MSGIGVEECVRSDMHGSTLNGRVSRQSKVAADAAARSGDLQTTVEYANGTRQTIQLWDQFRIWDPGD